MVVIWRVKIAEHGHGLKLRPPTPSCNHTWSPVLVPQAVLTAPTTERVSAIQAPFGVRQILEVPSKCPAELALALQIGNVRNTASERARKKMTNHCRTPHDHAIPDLEKERASARIAVTVKN